MRKIAASAFVVGFAAFAAAQPQYEVVDLTKQFGTDFSARTINNNGVVLGSVRLNHFQSQACVIESGKLTMLPMYQGKHPWYGIDINDNGDVLGGMELGGTTHTVLYRNGMVIDVGLQGSEFTAAGSALDNLGRVVGTFPVGIPQAFVWENGATTLLPGFSTGGSGASAINDSGVVAGASASGAPGSSVHAAKWVNGKITDVHPVWAGFSSAVSLNAHGEMAGWGWMTPGGQQGVVWLDGKVVQLTNFGGGLSRAYGINDASQVVGWATNSGGVAEAFLWEGGTMYKLGDHIGKHPGFGWLQGASAINNAGQILAESAGGPEANHDLVLTPVPETNSLITLFSGICVAVLLRRRRR